MKVVDRIALKDGNRKTDNVRLRTSEIDLAMV